METLAAAIYMNTSLPTPVRCWFRLIFNNQSNKRILNSHRKHFFQSLVPVSPTILEGTIIFNLMLKYAWFEKFLGVHGIYRELTLSEMLALDEEYDY